MRRPSRATGSTTPTGRLDATSAITDWKAWTDTAIGVHTPWGEEDSPAFVTAVQSALERELAEMLLRDTPHPPVRQLHAGEVLTRQGDPGSELYIIVDGVLVVSVDGVDVVELGPGAVLGERAILQGGRRAATVTAGTSAKVMVVPAERDRSRPPRRPRRSRTAGSCRCAIGDDEAALRHTGAQGRSHALSLAGTLITRRTR